MNRIAPALIVWLAALVSPSVADARWTRLTSEHFVFIGDASERQIRTIAQRLEMFHDVVGRVFSDRATSSPVQTVVIIFQNAQSFGPFRPMFNGKPVDVAGYFAERDDVNYIAINAEQDTEANGLIFHEYAHFLVHNVVGDVPPWADEGLAGFYETFEASSTKNAVIGAPHRYNLSLLQESTLLPIPQLIRVAHDSPMYNEGSRRGVFYAESWALVHYLTFGGPERSRQLRLFLSAVGQGAEGTQAFAEVFGADTTALERDLWSYARRIGMNSLRLEFDERIATSAGSAAQAISDQDAAGYLGELMAYANRLDDARAYLRKTIDGDANAARATASLGRLELRAGNDEAARPLLERAVSLGPDIAAAHRSYGRILLQQAEIAGSDRETLTSGARKAYIRALELEPNSASTAAALARIEMTTPSGAPRAVTLMQQVVKASPGREDYRYMLAQALVAQGDYAGATVYLGPLVGRARRPEIKEAARQLLGRMSALANASQPRGPSSAANPAPASAPTPSTGPAPSGGYDPVLRRVLAGETRVLGIFANVDCVAGAIVLQVDTADGGVRLAVARFEDVEFLTYRQDSPGSVACGAQRPAYRVLATFRTDGPPIAGANTANHAVAIELLPDGFVLR